MTETSTPDIIQYDNNHPGWALALAVAMLGMDMASAAQLDVADTGPAGPTEEYPEQLNPQDSFTCDFLTLLPWFFTGVILFSV